jgi:hypothetical protein
VTAEDRLSLLAEASRMLAATSRELAATLETLARIIDCVVFVVEADSGIRRVAEACVSEDNAAVLRKLREHPPAFGASNAVLSAGSRTA